MPAIPVDGNLDLLNTNKVVNVPTPTGAGDAVPKSYVDAVSAGIYYKQDVQAVATTNITLTAPGATIDGVTCTVGMRVLLTAQTTASQNGIWVWNSAATALTRPTDFATGSVAGPGTSVFAGQGTVYAKSVWTMNVTSNVTVDTTAETWVQSNGTADITVVAPLSITGNQISMPNPLPVTNGGTGGATAAAARTNLAVPGKYGVTVGDAAATTFTVTHNLGTSDVSVSVYDMATGNFELVGYAVTSANAISVGPFGTAPAAAGGVLPGGTGKRVVVVG